MIFLAFYLGNREAAISVIKEAKKHIPKEPLVYFNLANMLGRKDEFLVSGLLTWIIQSVYCNLFTE